jgi:hypothetical protein
MVSAASDRVNIKLNIHSIIPLSMSVRKPELLLLLDARPGLKGLENHA